MWNNDSFASVLIGQSHKPQIYTGEGEEDMLDDIGLIDSLQEQDIIEEGEMRSYVEIPLKYWVNHSALKYWS